MTDDRGWPYSEFSKDEDDQIRKPPTQPRKRSTKSKKEPARDSHTSFLGRLKNLFVGSKTPPEDIVEEPVDESANQVVSGDDVTMVIPRDARKIIVQILESNGRLKNQYTLTNYISVSGGDKFRVIVEK